MYIMYKNYIVAEIEGRMDMTFRFLVSNIYTLGDLELILILVFFKQYHINIYELIWLCPCPHNMRMISETIYCSQFKLIGQSLPIGEHGIGCSNFAFAANKGQKRLIISFKPMKRLKTENSDLNHQCKKVAIQNIV